MGSLSCDAFGEYCYFSMPEEPVDSPTQADKALGATSASNKGGVSQPLLTDDLCCSADATYISFAAARCEKASGNVNTARSSDSQRPDVQCTVTILSRKAAKPAACDYARSPSIDTQAQPERDQVARASPSAPPCPFGDALKAAAFAASSSHEPPLPRSHGGAGSRNSSGGGAPPSLGQQWHSTEWWRSFSSSRLNEMGVEEPNMRSIEMRKVPYVGGSEPMCALMHGGNKG